MTKNDSNTYIVTGATGGIGRALVDALVRRQAPRIVLAVRNTQKGQKIADIYQAHPSQIITMHLDLANLASVRDFAAAIAGNGWPVHALINNAGAMPGHIVATTDGYESATQINYVAPRLLTELLLPIISPGGAVIFTTSVTRLIVHLRDDWAQHALTHRGLGHRFTTYGRSKLMVAQYASQLSTSLASRNIRVNCCDPGIVDTNMINMGNRIIDCLSSLLFRPFISTPQQGAGATLRALDSPLSGYIFTQRGKPKRIINGSKTA